MSEPIEQQPIERRVVVVVEPQRWRSLARESRPTPWVRGRVPWAGLSMIGLLSLPALGSALSPAAAPAIALAAGAALADIGAPMSADPGPRERGVRVGNAIDDGAPPRDDGAAPTPAAATQRAPADVYELPPVIEGAVMIETTGQPWPRYRGIRSAPEHDASSHHEEAGEAGGHDCRDETG